MLQKQSIKAVFGDIHMDVALKALDKLALMKELLESIPGDGICVPRWGFGRYTEEGLFEGTLLGWLAYTTIGSLAFNLELEPLDLQEEGCENELTVVHIATGSKGLRAAQEAFELPFVFIGELFSRDTIQSYNSLLPHIERMERIIKACGRIDL